MGGNIKVWLHYTNEFIRVCSFEKRLSKRAFLCANIYRHFYTAGMCELFGMSANTLSAVTFSLTGFAARGGRTGEHGDGWGVAFYEDPAWQIYTDADSCAYSPVAQWLTQHSIKSRQVIAHVRKATQGQVASENCHPFSHFYQRRLWVFAHNGDLKNFSPKLSGSYLPQGNTDSEQAFALLLQHLENTSADIQNLDALFTSLLPVVGKIAQHGTFNFLFSNGAALFAHCSTHLYYLIRQHPFPTARLVDYDMSINLNEHNQPGDRMALIATHPLTSDEAWTKISLHHLLMFVEGQLQRIQNTEGISAPSTNAAAA